MQAMIHYIEGPPIATLAPRRVRRGSAAEQHEDQGQHYNAHTQGLGGSLTKRGKTRRGLALYLGQKQPWRLDTQSSHTPQDISETKPSIQSLGHSPTLSPFQIP